MENWAHNPTKCRHATDVKTYGGGLIAQKGLAIVYGDSNVGKSTWVAALLHNECQDDGWLDEDIMGRVATSPSSWYFAFEDGGNMRNTYDGFHTSYSERVDSIRPDRLYKKLPNGAYDTQAWERRILFAPPAGALDLTNAESVEAFCVSVHRQAEELIGDDANPNIIVIDNFSLCIGGADENDARTARQVLRSMGLIKEYFEGVELVILVCHARNGDKKPRGSEVLFQLIDSAVHLSGLGDTVTATNTKLRGATRGTQRRYSRVVMQGPKATYLDYLELQTVPARSKATKPAPAPEVDSAHAMGAEGPTAAPNAPRTPAAPHHPADKLKGRAVKAWAALGLKPGESITLADAKVLIAAHTCFEDVPKDRVGDRWKDVVDAFTNKGLVDTNQERVVNPA